MRKTVVVGDRPLKLAISKRAQAQLDRRTSALLLELELYFSCLVRKRVYVREQFDARDVHAVSDKLQVRFRPVVTETCAMREVERDNPPVRDMPIVNPERYFPHWLTLDFVRGEWLAEFGYARSPAGVSV
jgi:hypothetical protein